VREAIGNLRGLGVVTSRQGYGLSVADGNVMDTVSKAFVPLAASTKHWPDLCHFRYVLEVGSVPLAVVRASHEQMARMRELADEMLKLVRKRTGDAAELSRQIAEREIAFHQIVLDAAGGRLTSQFHQILVGYFDEAYGQGPHSAAPRVKDMQDHVRLVDAFAARDIAAAVEIMSDHIQPMLESSP
jgi:DNA-binding FadR family transcriptional regulator